MNIPMHHTNLLQWSCSLLNKLLPLSFVLCPSCKHFQVLFQQRFRHISLSSYFRLLPKIALVWWMALVTAFRILLVIRLFSKLLLALSWPGSRLRRLCDVSLFVVVELTTLTTCLLLWPIAVALVLADRTPSFVQAIESQQVLPPMASAGSLICSFMAMASGLFKLRLLVLNEADSFK